MQKRTLRTQSHQTVSRPSQDSGLMAKAKKPRQSARTESALDHRPHRTDKNGEDLPTKSIALGQALTRSAHSAAVAFTS
jgi:hypothetical protein